MPTVNSKRIALFDNVKGLLIVLVVLGHFMHPVHNDNEAMSAVFDVIYLFHMPLFIFVSGLFAKGAWRDGRLNVDRIISFLILGFAYQFLLLAITGILTPERMVMFTSAPWYLIGMAWWYLATPLFARLGPVRGMALAVCASFASGFLDLSDGFLAISRSLAFLPYFALGYFATTDQVERVSKSRWLWSAVAAAALIALTRIVDAHAYDWFFQMVYGDNPYGPDALAGMAGKLVTMAIAAVFSLAVLRIVPHDACPLETLGIRTLQIYVLHRLIRAWLTFHTGFYDLPVVLDPVWGMVLACAISAAVVALCALPVFTEPFDRLMRRAWGGTV